MTDSEHISTPQGVPLGLKKGLEELEIRQIIDTMYILVIGFFERKSSCSPPCAQNSKNKAGMVTFVLNHFLIGKGNHFVEDCGLKKN